MLVGKAMSEVIITMSEWGRTLPSLALLRKLVMKYPDNERIRHDWECALARANDDTDCVCAQCGQILVGVGLSGDVYCC